MLPLALLASGWYFKQHIDQTSSDTATIPVAAANTDPSDPAETHTDATSGSSENTIVTDTSQQATTSSQASPGNSNTQDSRSANRSSNSSAHAVGVDPLSDQDYAALLKRLRQEPEFLASLLEEYRLNTDPVRAKRLATLFGDLRNPEIVQTAATLVYSGNPDSQRMGLDLLSRLQPHDDEARSIAMDLLASETDPGLLVATLNVFATPAAGASTDHRELLLDNLNLLATHQHPLVRSHSISLIGRWGDGTDSNHLIAGLTDTSSVVRARSASALKKAVNPGTSVISGLLAVAEDSSEIKTTRQSALYSLQNMPMDDEARRRYEQAVIQVRRTRN